MSRRANRVIISERQQAHLLRLTHSTVCPRELAQRARIILLAYDKVQMATTAEIVGCERTLVQALRNRWTEQFPHLAEVECLESDEAFRTALVDVLSDLPDFRSENRKHLVRYLEEAEEPIGCR